MLRDNLYNMQNTIYDMLSELNEMLYQPIDEIDMQDCMYQYIDDTTETWHEFDSVYKLLQQVVGMIKHATDNAQIVHE